MAHVSDPEAFLETYVNLHEHLRQMRSRPTRLEGEKYARQLHLIETSRIVTETRDAIFTWVVNLVPDPKAKTLFILGGTGSGKSTTMCFLLGHDMKLNFDRCYDSRQLSELIGHDRTKSCTFLPNVYDKHDRRIVDFSGFDDTNGYWINQGMECALKKLLFLYNTILLVLQSITDTNSYFLSSSDLGARLSRLFADKSKCILGLTRYTMNRSYGQIETKKKKIRKLTASLDRNETKLNECLQKISDLEERLIKMSEDKGSNEEIERAREDLEEQQELRDKKRKKIAKNHRKMVRCHKIIKERNADLSETEKIFLTTTGLTKLMRLSDLTDTELRNSCWEMISSLESATVCKEHHIDSKAESALLETFKKVILPEINREAKYFNTLPEDEFFESVKKSSLTATLFSKTYPVVSEYSHMPEMDPQIAKKFDRMILDDALRMTEIAFMRRFPKKDYTKELKKYILDLHGKHTETKEQIKDGWHALQIKYGGEKGPFNIPYWAITRLIHSTLSPNRIEERGVTLGQVRFVMSILLRLKKMLGEGF